jgi:hypothetical protein
MPLKILKQKKENADWMWNIVFEKAKKGEATHAELVVAMDLCNKADRAIMGLENRQEADILKSDLKKLPKYFNGYAWYRPDDCKLFISNGEKFISQSLPYEAISFSQMDQILGHR